MPTGHTLLHLANCSSEASLAASPHEWSFPTLGRHPECETADVDDEGLLAEQRSYYRARAPEYDEWWQRRGRGEHGRGRGRSNGVARWRSSTTPSVVLDPRARSWNWQEVTGRGAERLAEFGRQPHGCGQLRTEALALNRERVGRPDVRCVVAQRGCALGSASRLPAMTRCSSPSGSRMCQGHDSASSGRFFAHA